MASTYASRPPAASKSAHRAGAASPHSFASTGIRQNRGCLFGVALGVESGMERFPTNTFLCSNASSSNTVGPCIISSSTKTAASMYLANCPRCGEPKPTFSDDTVTCRRCKKITPLTASSHFLKQVEDLWPGSEVTVRRARAMNLIKEHDEYLKTNGWYDIITSTLDENYKPDEDDSDGIIWDGGTD